MKPINVKIQVVVSTLSEQAASQVQQQLQEICPALSFSPCREQPTLNDCLEFFATGRIDPEIKESLLASLDNDFDQDDEDTYWAYGYNTKAFNPLVYYLLVEFN